MSGGPVKVTHPDMVRYFMTIPEAAQLVLEASSLGDRNEIYVLDMGEPIRIVDLASRMIRLMGYVPHRDIDIEFMGMRPGEKLYEEISTATEEQVPTSHPKIYVFRDNSLASEELDIKLSALQLACRRRMPAAVLDVVQSLVADYTPSKEIQIAVQQEYRDATAIAPELWRLAG
jgi:FlaA1/EpsC-like NDP-sugar epimerase